MGRDVLLIERFDRLSGGQGRHVVSGLTMLGFVASWGCALPMPAGVKRSQHPLIPPVRGAAYREELVCPQRKTRGKERAQVLSTFNV